ncbi:E3 ubiquitin-protein ligase At3g02290-like isoform X2 [Mercurialis annua]|uniref:E3 ubiquitin-protein ligase At3g02290-like isoform X2 n=1 Tax=Mercurialis annua TaxID=3986 RepID=UPI00215E2501|nr:E3 ubiquitin-protein ligase At3g02290-like isoform X2 [Mercurialis annua]
MGGLCCCPSSDEFQEYGYPTNSFCISLRLFFHHLLSGYGTMFHRLEGRPTSPTQMGSSLTLTGVNTGLADGFVNDAHISLSRPVPYDADQRFTRLQRDGLVSRKSMTHFQEEAQSLRRSVSNLGTESSGFGKNQNEVDSEDDSKPSRSDFSEKILATKTTYGLSYLHSSSEYEDVCPTCLDEYTPENPKITTRCSHHFHLGCIYEWLERSENCPICGKEMEFCESP